MCLYDITESNHAAVCELHIAYSIAISSARAS